MMDIEVINGKNGSLMKLSEVEDIADIMPCVGNIRALTELIMQLAQERELWLEPSEAMYNAGIGEVQQFMDEAHEDMDFDAREMSDEQAGNLAVFVLQAMAGKRNG